jgi:Tfp pilus assembly protein PilE
MVPFMRPFFGQASIRSRAAFTVLEILVVVGILGVLSGVIIASGSKSFQRSKINAVAVELAGWLTAIHAKNKDGCYVDYVGTTTTPLPTAVSITSRDTGALSSGAAVYKFRATTTDPDSTKNCSDPSGAQVGFRLPANVGGGYTLRLYDLIIFSPRGTIAMADNATTDTSTNYIKIFHAGSGLLRCIRINYWTGIVEIGSKSNATAIGNNCDTSFVRF